MFLRLLQGFQTLNISEIFYIKRNYVDVALFEMLPREEYIMMLCAPSNAVGIGISAFYLCGAYNLFAVGQTFNRR